MIGRLLWGTIEAACWLMLLIVLVRLVTHHG